ncbi:MAG TPA: hypothetical protein VE685_07440 [Thermoanaerobaculia bacterium]|nr:hypothetical protein [Thermoanaerobaculia bacterium]
MKRHAIGALVLLCLFAGAASGNAQSWEDEICYPDCPGSTWGPKDFMGNPILQHQTVVLPNGCKLTVDYLTRCACNTWNDIFVHSVTPDPSDPDCAFLSSLPVGQILDIVTEEFLKGAYDIPRPCDGDIAVGECNTTWRVVKGSCWSQIGSPPSQYYYPCTQTACCLKPYEVCRDECGRKVTPFPSAPYGSCPGAQPAFPHVSGPCEPVCG